MRAIGRVCCLVALAWALGMFWPGGVVHGQEDGVENAAEPSRFTAWQESFDQWFGETVVSRVAAVFYFEIGPAHGETEDGLKIVRKMPVIVIVLFIGGFFFTFRYGFINIRLFRHLFAVLRGKYDRPEDAGEVTHFKALTSALSATVGLGNIAGVALAISLGGPGAVFWMWFTAFFGMSMKFSSAAFAQLYRRVGDDGRVLGGPMIYLEQGLKEKSPALGVLGRVLAIVFAVLTVCSAFSAGNMFQANQTSSIIALQFFPGNDSAVIPLMVGLVLSVLVGIVIIGGIRRIGDITSKLVPTMCLFYCGVCLVIVVLNIGAAPAMLASIVTNAFSPEALYGGFVGVLVMGMRRAAFSNEAGLGSASIAQAAAKTGEPVQAGDVSRLVAGYGVRSGDRYDRRVHDDRARDLNYGVAPEYGGFGRRGDYGGGLRSVGFLRALCVVSCRVHLRVFDDHRLGLLRRTGGGVSARCAGDRALPGGLRRRAHAKSCERRRLRRHPSAQSRVSEHHRHGDHVVEGERNGGGLHRAS